MMACDGIDPWTWNLTFRCDRVVPTEWHHATYVAGQTHRGPGSCHWCLHFWTKKRHTQFWLKSGEPGNSKGPEAKFGSGLGRLRSTINNWNKQKLFLQNHHKSSLFGSLGSFAFQGQWHTLSWCSTMSTRCEMHHSTARTPLEQR